MGRRSGEARRAKKAEREELTQESALTFRQRVGVSLSKLTQRELDTAVKSLANSGRANDVGALARLADQAFGRPLPAEEDVPGDEGLASLTREERAVLRQMLEEGLNMDESEPQLVEEPSPSA
jgi:DNA-binding NarL/FixJ family response regulator